MQPLRFHGPYALLLDEGLIPGAPGGPWRQAYRAICPPSTEPLRVIVPSSYGDPHLLHTFAPDVAHANRPRVVSTLPALNTIAFSFTPGVTLRDAFTQAAQLEGQLPVEACAFIVANAARGIQALHESRQLRVDEVSTSRIEVGFAGEVHYTGGALAPPPFDLPDAPPALHEDDDYDMLILVVQPWPPLEERRRVPREELLTPEEARHEAGDLRSDIFLLGGVLQLLLEGVHPFTRDNLLASLDAVRRGARHPLRREVPTALHHILERALALAPEDRFASMSAFAGALDALYDPRDSARWLAGWLGALYPEAKREQLDFVEQARMLDITVVNAQPHLAPLLVESPDVDHRGLNTLVPVRRDVSAMHHRNSLWIERRLVSNAQFVRFLDDVSLPDPHGFHGRTPELSAQPAVNVPPQLARRYAQWAGRVLPTEPDWRDAARGGGYGRPSSSGVVDLCRVWEWTSTPVRSGFVVRGGPWRNREDPALVDNRSWENEGAVDVGFRCALYVDDNATSLQDDWDTPTE